MGANLSAGTSALRRKSKTLSLRIIFLRRLKKQKESTASVLKEHQIPLKKQVAHLNKMKLRPEVNKAWGFHGLWLARIGDTQQFQPKKVKSFFFEQLNQKKLPFSHGILASNLSENKQWESYYMPELRKAVWQNFFASPNSLTQAYRNHFEETHRLLSSCKNMKPMDQKTLKTKKRDLPRLEKDKGRQKTPLGSGLWDFSIKQGRKHSFLTWMRLWFTAGTHFLSGRILWSQSNCLQGKQSA